MEGQVFASWKYSKHRMPSFGLGKCGEYDALCWEDDFYDRLKLGLPHHNLWTILKRIFFISLCRDLR
jgi:hypothetical protein